MPFHSGQTDNKKIDLKMANGKIFHQVLLSVARSQWDKGKLDPRTEYRVDSKSNWKPLRQLFPSQIHEDPPEELEEREEVQEWETPPPPPPQRPAAPQNDHVELPQKRFEGDAALEKLAAKNKDGRPYPMVVDPGPPRPWREQKGNNRGRGKAGLEENRPFWHLALSPKKWFWIAVIILGYFWLRWR